ncbi:GAF domain-containing protein [Cytophagaceae bacterium DM2B3-1]|uniref:GAF domain-containing protein n=1 Tax=Xanthocytophaga flava TaxID=3048013 RepID=A0ABT7CD17_9BACT|nr:GAF domain-containing protein [Xanthocytophaga flavus]MDJ1491579.1 GAF domain-containing protein [Xanthocytophaga flavus]
MNKRKLYTILSIVAIAGLLASIGYVWYQYISLTDKAHTLSGKEIATSWVSIKNLIQALGTSVAICSGVTLVTLAILLLSRNNGEVQVVYVKKSEEKQYGLDTSDDDQDEMGKNHNASSMESILAEQSRDLKPVFEKLLSSVCRELEASQAIIFVAKRYEGKRILELFATYAYHIAESKTFHYEFGEGLAGQAAKEGKQVVIKNIPDGYVTVLSGLGKASPAELLIAPVIYDEQVVAVVEIASFKRFTRSDEALVTEVTRLISNRINSQFLEEEVISLVPQASLV